MIEVNPANDSRQAHPSRNALNTVRIGAFSDLCDDDARKARLLAPDVSVTVLPPGISLLIAIYARSFSIGYTAEFPKKPMSASNNIKNGKGR